MKKIIMSGLMVIMALSVFRGAAAGMTAEAKSKTASHHSVSHHPGHHSYGSHHR